MLYNDNVFFSNTLKNISRGVYDFVIIPPTLTLCATSLRLNHLLMRIRQRDVYELESGMPTAGGVIVTRAHNYGIRTFQDLKGKVLGVPE